MNNDYLKDTPPNSLTQAFLTALLTVKENQVIHKF